MTPEEEAKLIWDSIEKSARYLFNKSHAVSYGALTAKTAYLKRHFPEQYLASFLNNQAVKKSGDFKGELMCDMDLNYCKFKRVNIFLPYWRSIKPEFVAVENGVNIGINIIKNCKNPKKYSLRFL